MGGLGLDCFGSSQVPAADCCEYGSKPAGFTQCGEFLDEMRDC